jgi:hypothetical protein
MKKILLLSLLVAQSSNAWEINQNDVAVQASENQISINEFTTMVYATGYLSLSRFISDSCGGQNEITRIYEVNKTPVKFNVFCNGDSNRSTVDAIPKTEKGKAFLLNEFKTKNTVTIGKYKFSAIGFNDATLKIKAVEERNKNAI